VNCECGKPAEPGRDECFRCRVSGVSFAFRGGALVGRSGWHKTRAEHHQQQFGMTEKELAKRPNIERAET